MKTILTKYIGPTNTRGSRIKAYDCDGNSITIGYDSDLSIEDAHTKAARALCVKMNWSPCKLACGGIKHGNAFVILGRDNFNIIEV